MKILCLGFAMLLAIYAAAQTTSPQKIGHANWEYIFSRLPEYKQIEHELGAFEAQLQNQLKLKSQELDAKYKAYQAMSPDVPDAIRKDREAELAYLQDNIQKFQQEAQLSIQKKQADLINPVLAKVGKAIEAVAIENGFSYIINPQMVSGGDVLLFTDEQYNISNLVLKKLGVDVSKLPSSAAKPH
ncbi:OmpH family outer membrane protein [Ohtaekwangia sp.]|uniref:OmpH family outer membrane protein n=1 Tax=Ohtaekwangia sp. TaxID=2066019 RepID=UPI002FDE7DEB